MPIFLALLGGSGVGFLVGSWNSSPFFKIFVALIVLLMLFSFAKKTGLIK